MKKRTRTRKSLTVKKRIVGFFAIAVILLGVVGGFSINKVIAESDNTTGNGAAAPVAVLAKTSASDSTGGGGSAATNANVLVGDNTGTSTGSQTQAKDTDYTPSVSVNNMSTYPQTGDAHDTGLVILGFTILIGLFAFYGLKFRKSFQSLHVSKVTN